MGPVPATPGSRKKEITKPYIMKSYINDIVGKIENNAKPFWRYIGNHKGQSKKIQ